MSIVFAIILFSLLIFVHELGHFVAAKLSGVQVNEFALFMGPAIFKKTIGETTYSLRCIPIGGYCAMEGEDEDTENPRAFRSAAWWKRLIILLAGAAMNFVVGFLLLLAVAIPAERISQPVIDFAQEGCTIVCEDGLHVGDRILKVDGENVYLASDFSMILSLNPGQVHDLEVLRGGERIVLDDYVMQKHMLPDENGQLRELYGIRFGSVEGNFLNTLEYTWNNALGMVRSVRLSLQMLFTGKAGLQDMTGPVGIVQIMSDTAAASPTAMDAFLNMLNIGGFIAINLAVMNLLPIPALDGGRAVGLLLTTAIEKITRKKLNAKYEAYIHGAGMILLLALMAIILFKDVFTIFKG